MSARILNVRLDGYQGADLALDFPEDWQLGDMEMQPWQEGT